MNYNYIYWSLLYDKTEELIIRNNSKVGLQNQIVNFQYSTIDGFISNGKRLKILNCLCVGNYPSKYKKILIKEKKWDYRGLECFDVGSINLPFFKQFVRTKKVFQKTEELISVDCVNVVIMYSLYLPFLNAAKKLKEKYENLIFVGIVPDLPSIYGVLPSNRIKRIFYKNYGDKILKESSCIDKYILLTNPMADILKVKNNFCVVDGLVNPNFSLQTNLKKDNILLYTGSIDKVFGIEKLVELMKYLPSDYQLWICGAGDYQSILKEKIKRDSRIKYFGFVSKEESVQKQITAKLLINPREDVGEYVKYSFPSKTLEYLQSGTPLIMNKLSCLSDEYDDYIYYFSSNSPQQMAGDIKKICELPDELLHKRGCMAKEFVNNNKNCKQQVKKIINMVEEKNV